jgi:hypothetical protein
MIKNGTDGRSIHVPNRELNQLRKIADKYERRGFDYPTRTRTARAAIYLACHHEWTREEIQNAFKHVGDEEEDDAETVVEPTVRPIQTIQPAQPGETGITA